MAEKAAASRSVRVLIVDDSALVRSIVSSALRGDPQITVVGQAADGADALAKIQALRPDVVTLDVEMPRMNGLEVLERVAGKVPVAFLMCSTLTTAGARITFEALQRGAVDYVPKPDSGLAAKLEFQATLRQKVLNAAAARTRVRALLRPAGGANGAPQLPPNRARGWVVAIGISCGGPQTLHQMLPAFPSDFVPIVVTQHMPAQFTRSFAEHLNAACAMRVEEAREGQPIQPGVILIAPGGAHLHVVRRGIELAVRLVGGPKVSGHKPSVDAMFASLAQSCGPRCVACVMTGMGNDGAEGIRMLKQAGARTLAQDQATSLVYGMPKAAAETGCVDQVASLGELPGSIARMLQSSPGAAAATAGAKAAQ